jgi:hypothetical protein
MHMNTKKIISITTGLALAASMALAIPAFAATNSSDQSGDQNQSNSKGQGQQIQGRGGQVGANPGADAKRGSGIPGRPAGMVRPGIFGIVTAVSGNIITINGRQGFGSTTATTTYTVDATNATIRKGNATSTISSIVVGDTISVQGTITGTNIVATAIFDGINGSVGGRGQGDQSNGNDGKGDKSSHATSTLPFLGNGQPVVAGKVSAVNVNGASLTVTTASNVIYTVNASSSKILEGQNTIALSSVLVGDTVLVQGTVNGTSITASTIVDQSSPAASVTANLDKGQKRGFFGGIGQFFMHLFGF